MEQPPGNANVSFASPAAAFQTLNWAAGNRDTNAFLNALSWDPQARQRAEALFDALPERMRQQYGSVDGVTVDWMLRGLRGGVTQGGVRQAALPWAIVSELFGAQMPN